MIIRPPVATRSPAPPIALRRIKTRGVDHRGRLPRDLFRLALEHHVASIIVFHNHRSGDPAPSPEDVQFTRKLLQAGTVVDVDVVDHITVAASGYVSMKQHNWT
jgi:DNA repair protein RadC